MDNSKKNSNVATANDNSSDISLPKVRFKQTRKAILPQKKEIEKYWIETKQEENLFAILPYEIHVHVMSYLDPVDLFSVSLVCRYWWQVANDDILFKLKLPQGVDIDSLLMPPDVSGNKTNQNIDRYSDNLTLRNKIDHNPSIQTNSKWRVAYRRWKSLRECGVGYATFTPEFLHNFSLRRSQLRGLQIVLRNILDATLKDLDTRERQQQQQQQNFDVSSEQIQQCEFKLLMFGKPNSGKTSLLYKLKTGSYHEFFTTFGFNNEVIEYRNCRLEIKDVGSHNDPRTFWNIYSNEVHGIIWVIDSTSTEASVVESVEALTDLLIHVHNFNVPVYIFATKQDHTYLDAKVIASFLLDQGTLIAQEQFTQRKWYIQPCSARYGFGLKLDKLIDLLRSTSRPLQKTHTSMFHYREL